jgi:uncharacterized protein YfaP (DUF2135 family)
MGQSRHTVRLCDRVLCVAWLVPVRSFDWWASRTYAVAGPVKSGQLRIVLTWGETPRDLDSHLDTPSGCHVFYGRKQCRGEASLDTDVTDSFGPETINIAKLEPGVYKYFHTTHPTLISRVIHACSRRRQVQGARLLVGRH